MSLPADYHLHTPLCRHASGEPVELAAQAVALNLPEIGFSDHAPMPRDNFDNWRMNPGQLDDYVARVEEARRKFPDLVIKLGLEVDYFPDGEEWVRELSARHAWDYFIGSVHYISPTWAIDNPEQVAEWRHRDPWAVWSAYFERLTQAAECGLFDIIGHADLCKKFCFYPKEDCTPLIERFLAAAKQHGAAIELNTAGLRKQCREIYPGPGILALARELEVPITFGSDAHAREEVGFGLASAVTLARGAGYTSYLRYTRRRPEPASL
jgi:histidinol-phosphatase (PHP family)